MALEMKYFVLKPRGDSPFALASQAAMERFAKMMAPHDMDLSRDLLRWVQDERDRILAPADGEEG